MSGSHPDTLMAVTIEDLYRNYGILADAKENLSQVKACKYTFGLILIRTIVTFNGCTGLFSRYDW